MVAIDVIFFDVDGTLVDSRKDIAIAMNYILALSSRHAWEELICIHMLGYAWPRKTGRG